MTAPGYIYAIESEGGRKAMIGIVFTGLVIWVAVAMLLGVFLGKFIAVGESNG